jgi:hypothetical protein
MVIPALVVVVFNMSALSAAVTWWVTTLNSTSTPPLAV